MQLWFAHGSEVTIREQLVTQVILSILGDELAPGERLPSTRDLARRFRIHANTVSAGYRQLEREGWVESRRGSGVFVRAARPALTAEVTLDRLIANLFRSARKLEVPLPALRERLHYWLELQPPDRFLLIEPDEELRRIVLLELRQAVKLPVVACGFPAPGRASGFPPETLVGAIPLALPSKVAKVRAALPAELELLPLHVQSVPASLARYLPAPSEALIGIASRWPDFLKLARTMLIASGFSPECLVVRDARDPNWRRGLRQLSAVVCDSATAAELQAKPSKAAHENPHLICFSLLADTSLLELQRYEQSFFRSPMDP